jgi:hypothetical protein
MGGRISKSGPLSDDNVIDFLNQEFNVVELVITDLGFPAWVEALAPYKKIYDTTPAARKAFPTPVVVDPEGTFLIASGDGGRVMPKVEDSAMIYDKVRYLEWLKVAAERTKQYEALRNDQALSAEVRAQRIASLRLEISHDLEKSMKAEPSFLKQIQMGQLGPSKN